MKTSIPKLHSVKLKTGGAQLRVLHNMTAHDTCKELQRAVDRIKETRKDDAAGYAIVVWADDGQISLHAYAPSDRWLNIRQVPDFTRSALHDLCWDD